MLSLGTPCPCLHPHRCQMLLTVFKQLHCLIAQLYLGQCPTGQDFFHAESVRAEHYSSLMMGDKTIGHH